jgi:LPS-assembly protein
LISILKSAVFYPEWAEAQVERPDRDYLFIEDRDEKDLKKAKRKALKDKKQAAKQSAQNASELPFDINAKSIQFDSTGSVINAEGDVIITYSSVVAEALRGRVDITKSEAQLEGDVRVSDVTSNITADTAYLDLDNGAGELQNANIYFEDGDYRLTARKADRRPGDVFLLEDAELTTCRCPEGDDCKPWTLRAKDAEITREGYGFAWNSTLHFSEVPVFYFPFLVFPAKNERQSGFIPMSIGGGKESGVNLRLPFFWAIDDSTDATLTGIYESSTRAGTDIEFRKILSRRHELEAGFIYLNDSPRDGDLQGTNVSGLNDPTFDDNRFAGYLDETWQGSIGDLDLQLIVDANYVSDDLLLREYDKEKIADYNSRFVVSKGVVRAPLGESFSLDVAAEGNQAIVDDDDFIFQRVPEITLDGLNTFKPFGESQFGLKLVVESSATFVNFIRKKSFEGMRAEIYESATIPFHFRNYFDGSIKGSIRGTNYNLTDDKVVDESDGDATLDDMSDDGVFDESEVVRLDKNSNRLIPEFTSGVGTVFEKVFSLEDGNWIKNVSELGRIGRSEEIVRLKHTIEPKLKHQFVPSVNQSENPQFDASDRLAQKNVVTYSLTQRLFGRFEPRNPYLYGIEEVTPEVEDLGSLRSPGILDQAGTFGFDQDGEPQAYQAMRRGSVVELASFELSQTFDILEERKDRDPTRKPLSDLAAKVNLFPNEHVRFSAQTDYGIEEQEFSSYSIESQLTSKRGDSLRTRLRFVDSSVRQLETSAELKVSSMVRLGYYSRYDDLNGEFIEQKAGVRLNSSCRCWVFDLDVSDKINPDETEFSFKLTLVGLGELGNTLFASEDESNS